MTWIFYHLPTSKGHRDAARGLFDGNCPSHYPPDTQLMAVIAMAEIRDSELLKNAERLNEELEDLMWENSAWNRGLS